jgi:hypothetical protein
VAINNAQPAVDIPLDAFLGLVTESDITSLPPGSSPDNQDITFTPGGFDSRDGLHRIFPAGDTTTYVYEKTFVQDNTKPLNLYLDSAGVFWQEDVTAAPGVKTQVHAGTPGLYAQSVTAFGREWIAFSDAKHGADIPRQYDGTFFDRVTQDGPAAAVTAADFGAQVNIVNPTGITPVFATVNIAAAFEQPAPTPNIVQVTTATPHGLFQGEEISIQGVVTATYNGIWSVLTVPDQFTFTYFNPTAGLVPQGAAGTVRVPTVQVTTTAPHGMIAGAQFTIAGTSAAVYNNNVSGNPSSWTVQTVISPTVFLFVPNVDPVNSNGGTIQVGGQISPGVHKVVMFFITRMDAQTKPSLVAQWLSSGGKQVQLTNLPIGPANVIARGFAFTGAGGGNYFHVPAAAAGSMSMILADNTSTSVVLDFADNTLFGAEGIDIPGNNLFAQRVLGPCLGFTFYASRIGAWGEYRRIENLLNMGFEGGTLGGAPNVPLGWTVGANPGVLDSGAADFGLAWKITGDGTNNPRGVLSQSAFQDSLNIPIADQNTFYSLRLWARAGAAGLLGNIKAILSSVSTGFTATAQIAINTCSTLGGFVQGDFNLATPAVIPADLLLTIEVVGLNNAATIELDEIEIVFTAQPFLDGVSYWSYFENPEGFDAVTGKLQPTDDDSAVQFFCTLRRYLIMATAQGMHRSIDGAGEPETWDVDPISGAVGALSFRGGDPGKFGKGDTGEEWVAIASYNGLYLYGGGPLWKVSQENQPIWDRINKAAAQTLWIKNDPGTRRIYLGLPLDQATAPNAIYPLDYRELDTDQQIAGAPSVRISPYSGRVLATDMSRKWTRWNIMANCGEILARGNGVYQFCLGAGNGVTPGQLNGFGNVYFLDPAKLTDDDYGQIVPYWVSYLFPSHDQEQQLQLGSGLHTFCYSFYFATGVGQLIVTPLAGSLANPRPASAPRVLNLTQLNDIEIPLNVTASRTAFKIAVIPLQGKTDVQLSLSKMIICVRKNAMGTVRGAR